MGQNRGFRIKELKILYILGLKVLPFEFINKLVGEMNSFMARRFMLIFMFGTMLLLLFYMFMNGA